MDASSFINAFCQFFSIRGPVKQIRSDCGTNFVGMIRELKIKAVSCYRKVQQYPSDNTCTCVINPLNNLHTGAVGINYRHFQVNPWFSVAENWTNKTRTQSSCYSHGWSLRNCDWSSTHPSGNRSRFSFHSVTRNIAHSKDWGTLTSAGLVQWKRSACTTMLASSSSCRCFLA